MTPSAVGRFCLVLFAFLIPLRAQQPQLRVIAIEGEGALNNTTGRAARDVVVEVQGANARPIAGAEVTFNLPLTGASAVFANGERTLIVTTDAQGRAAATGMRPNNITGPVQIRVAATYLDQTATAVITQTNVAIAEEIRPVDPASGSSSPGGAQPAPRRGMSKATKILLILGIVGGAAAGAGIALGSGGSNGGGGGGGGPAPPIVITPGVPTVGGPQ